MNTYKSKSIRLIKRLTHFARSKASKKSQTTVSNTQPLINKLYSLDFVHAGAVQKSVTGRYAGKSRSGKYMLFELVSFFTAQGQRIRLLCLDTMPLKLKPLKKDLFTLSKAA